MSIIILFGDGFSKTIYVNHPYFVRNSYPGVCSKNAREAYEVIGGKIKLMFTAYYVVSKVDEYGIEDPFSKVLVGCFKDLFYMAKFDYEKGTYVTFHKKPLKDLPDGINFEQLLI